MQTEIIGGRNAVLEALKSSRRQIVELMISESSDDRRLRAAMKIARRKGIRVSFHSRKELDELAHGLNHQGIIAVASPMEYSPLDEIIERAFLPGTQPLIVVLDHIQDPHNLGAIIRTAEAVGAHGVVIPKKRAVGVTPAVVKTSSGATDHIPIARVSNIVQSLERLKDKGVWTIGLIPDADRTIYQVDLTGPIALVIGGEGEGISRLVSERCDLLASIPMSGKVGSLNASVAAAVAMYEVFRQRLCPS
jgi:23S rRNA (guanosine2251-2'-O)-methyltransferase